MVTARPRSIPITSGASDPRTPRRARQVENLTWTVVQRMLNGGELLRELRKANEILKLASAFFAQAELDRRIKS